MSRHPVNPRHQRNAKRANPPRRPKARRPKYPRYREPLPPGITAGCRVGELLVPVLGLDRVLAIAAEGGLLPYVVTTARRLAARMAALAGSA